MHTKIKRFKKENATVWRELSDDERKQRVSILRQMKCEQRQVNPIRETTYKSLQYVRYADDFLIGIIGSKKDAENLKSDLTVFLREKLGLTLSAEKTKIAYTGESARFLGYDIKVSRSNDVRKLKNGVKARAIRR